MVVWDDVARKISLRYWTMGTLCIDSVKKDKVGREQGQDRRRRRIRRAQSKNKADAEQRQGERGTKTRQAQSKN